MNNLIGDISGWHERRVYPFVCNVLVAVLDDADVQSEPLRLHRQAENNCAHSYSMI